MACWTPELASLRFKLDPLAATHRAAMVGTGRADPERPVFALHVWLPNHYLGEHVLGLEPLHALAIGFFGSMLLAMVTRITHGHSGRPLQVQPVPCLCFVLL